MKGEPGRPAGAGWAAAPRGGEAGAQGEGWARLPKRTYCPGLAAGAPPGPSRPTQRRHLSPAAGSACLLLGAKAHGLEPPFSDSSGSCQSPGSAWHPAGLPEETLSGVAELLEGRGGSGKLRGSRGRPRPVPRARTPNSSSLRREGAAAGPGRACARTRCHPWGLVSAPGLAPSRLGGPSPPGKCGQPAQLPAAATSESVRARARRASR